MESLSWHRWLCSYSSNGRKIDNGDYFSADYKKAIKSKKGRSQPDASPFSLFCRFILLSLLFAFFRLFDAPSYAALLSHKYHTAHGNGDCSHYDIDLFDAVPLSFHNPRLLFLHKLILSRPLYHLCCRPRRLYCQRPFQQQHPYPRQKNRFLPLRRPHLLPLSSPPSLR